MLMTLRDRLAALDRKVVGNAPTKSRPWWFVAVLVLFPAATGAATTVAYNSSPTAAVGVFVGLLLTVPLAVAVRAASRR